MGEVRRFPDLPLLCILEHPRHDTCAAPLPRAVAKLAEGVVRRRHHPSEGITGRGIGGGGGGGGGIGRVRVGCAAYEADQQVALAAGDRDPCVPHLPRVADGGALALARGQPRGLEEGAAAVKVGRVVE